MTQSVVGSSISFESSLSDGDLRDLSVLTNDVIADGGAIHWTLPLPHKDLHRYWTRIAQSAKRGAIHPCFARLNGRIIGSAQLHVLSNRTTDASAHVGRLTTLIVAPTTRRQGIGRRLMEAVESRARQIGLAVLELDVRADAAAAVHLYDANGYMHWGTHPVYARVEGRFIQGYYYYKLL